MKVLVTGANGHLGSNLIRELLKEKRQVKAFVRKTSDLRGLKGLNVELCYGDIMDKESILNALNGCETVYHCAAVFKNQLKDPMKDAFIPTVQGTKNIIEACHKKSIKKVIYVSSIATVGSSKKPEEVRNETQWSDSCKTPYHKAKMEAELFVRNFFNKTGLDIVTVLPGAMFGPYAYSITPSMKIIHEFLNGNTKFIYDAEFNIVDVRDVARGMILAEKKGKPGDRYLLTGEPMSMQEIVTYISSITGLPAAYRKLGKNTIKLGIIGMGIISRIRGSAQITTKDSVDEFIGVYQRYDISKAKKELDYSTRPKEETLKDAVKWFVGNGMAPGNITVN